MDGYNENLSLYYNYLSTESYLSLGNQYIFNLARMLDITDASKTSNLRHLDYRTKISTLLSTKYFISDSLNYVPYGYSLYEKIGKTGIYKNNNFLSIGILYDNYILEEDYNNLSPLQKEDALITTAVIENDINYIKKENSIKDKLTNVNSLKYTTNVKTISTQNKIITKVNGQSISIKIQNIKPDTELYLNIRNLKFDTKSNNKSFRIITVFNEMSKAEKTRDQIISAYYVDNSDYLINLGKITENTDTELKIIFEKKGTYTFDSLEILEVPLKGYEEKIKKLQENQMTNIEWGNNFIKGSINSDKNGILQITTPYSHGWQAFVDGERVDVIKVNEGFIGIPIEAGQHIIEFKYTTPYLNLGIIFSLIGFVRINLHCNF